LFDYIGLVLGFLALLALSIGAGLVVAALTVLVFWSRWRRAIPLGIGAVILAPLCVIWLFATVALLPGESLFGDIDQPLPNGYRVSALGKMPDFADISSANGADGLSEYVASLHLHPETKRRILPAGHKVRCAPRSSVDCGATGEASSAAPVGPRTSVSERSILR
jgi:hypothetical protein